MDSSVNPFGRGVGMLPTKLFLPTERTIRPCGNVYGMLPFKVLPYKYKVVNDVGRLGILPVKLLSFKNKSVNPFGNIEVMVPFNRFLYRYNLTNAFGSDEGMLPNNELSFKAKYVTLEGIAVPLIVPFNPILYQEICVTR